MRKDQCLFCTSRRCSYRIVTEDLKTYDQICCIKHYDELEKHSNETAPKIMKWFISGTGYYSRGDKFTAV